MSRAFQIIVGALFAIALGGIGAMLIAEWLEVLRR